MKSAKTMWMLKSPSGNLVTPSASHTRKGCIAGVLSSYGPNWTWKKLYRNGSRIVRVSVREI